jgi:hypothetical protein
MCQHISRRKVKIIKLKGELYKEVKDYCQLCPYRKFIRLDEVRGHE